ncbi:MAG: DNA-directed RNA polymerase subunit K [Candidatus Hadarchaeales archaeon]
MKRKKRRKKKQSHLLQNSKLKGGHNIFPEKYTRYEKARIIGARALQISLGAPILINPPKGITDPVEIALYEFEQGVIPITVIRRLPDERIRT